jgi:hypothetical protein
MSINAYVKCMYANSGDPSTRHVSFRARGVERDYGRNLMTMKGVVCGNVLSPTTNLLKRIDGDTYAPLTATDLGGKGLLLVDIVRRSAVESVVGVRCEEPRNRTNIEFTVLTENLIYESDVRIAS